MKKQNLRVLIILLCCIICQKDYAGNVLGVKNEEDYIWAKNEDGVWISYKYLSDNEVCVAWAQGKYSGEPDNFVVTTDYEPEYPSNEYKGKVTIPETVQHSGKTYAVTEIGEYAFFACKYITSITIPNSVRRIGKYAFWCCTGLTSVTIPNSVTTIADYAFLYCTGLTSVTIGTGIISIGNRAFFERDSLRPTKVIWLSNTPPEGYKEAFGVVNYFPNEQYSSFSDNVYPFLSSIFEVGGVKYVPVSPSERTCDAIDCNYDSSAENINIGETVTYKGVTMSVRNVKEYVCYRNPFIKDVNFSFNGNVPGYAFNGCTGFQTVTLSNQGSVGDYAFKGCTGLTSVTIPNSVTTIADYAFGGCTGLQTVTLSNQGSVGDGAFIGCTKLKTATLGNQVTALYEYAFSGCSSLESIIVPDAVTYVGKYAFSYCTSLISAKIGSGVTKINNSAFYNCSSLTDIQIGSNVGLIDDHSFQNCVNLPSIRIPKSVMKIGRGAFSGCSGLKQVIIEDGGIRQTFADWISTNKLQANSTSSNEYIFEVLQGDNLSFNWSVDSENYCDFLEVTLDGTTIIKESGQNRSGHYIKIFSDPGRKTLKVSYIKNKSGSRGSDEAKIYNIGLNLESLSLGSNGSDPLFSSCPLDTVYIGRNISYSTTSSSGYSPFYRNTSLRSVKITDKKTEISPNEFYGCTNLQNVYIGDGVTTIGDWAFSGCSSLGFFAIGSSVETIGKEAFSDCTAMTKFISNAPTPPTCSSQALDDINKWTCTLQVPNNSISLYQAAPQWKDFFFIEDIPTGITFIERESKREDRVYDVDGRHLSRMHRGINIIKSSDGTTRKVLVR